MLLAFSTGFGHVVPAPLHTERPSTTHESLPEELFALAPLVRTVIAAVLTVPREHADVDDGTSETMRRAVEGRSRLRAGEPLRPWLVGIARHVALDARRARARTYKRTLGGTGDDGLLERIPTRKPDPFERLVRARRDAKVRGALLALPEGPRTALSLFHLEELGYEEIAAKLNVPLGTVGTWIARGRKQLEAALADEKEEP